MPEPTLERWFVDVAQIAKSPALDSVKELAVAHGYRIETITTELVTDTCIEERLMRPDGSVAVIARRRLPGWPNA